MASVHVACVVGARPNFMKMAPILRALAAIPEIQTTLIHTGQHYDAALSDVFFRQLGIPEPDIDLGVGSGSQAVQTARVLEGMERVLLAGPVSAGLGREDGGQGGDGGTTKDTKSTKLGNRGREREARSEKDHQPPRASDRFPTAPPPPNLSPLATRHSPLTPASSLPRYDRVIVVGDVNSTLAATLAAVKLGIPVAHVEAGLRSFDRSMPEEINRLMTDAVCDLLLVSEPSGVENLLREGHPESRVHLVGNVMIDTLRDALPKLDSGRVLGELGVRPSEYGVVTLHRPANVDDPETLRGILEVLAEASRRLPLLFPVHPRTAARIEQFGLGELLANHPRLRLLAPQGYLEFLALTSSARVIVTDSGGLQEESTALGIPCLTLRPNTERPITVEEGTSTLVGSDPHQLRQRLEEVLSGTYELGKCPELWDGRSAERIAEVIAIAHGLQPQPVRQAFQPDQPPVSGVR